MEFLDTLNADQRRAATFGIGDEAADAAGPLLIDPHDQLLGTSAPVIPDVVHAGDGRQPRLERVDVLEQEIRIAPG